ncbi:MAG: rhomboid family intramembrane serine protease [Candidatus Izemoplasmatales bacterium]|nr:rhomboid family intramembrane serine protease [bacterium]MDZ4197210.1 rhomboid family intramembrane serine protease [Candidatus Izemoplasmatales bacterium]
MTQPSFFEMIKNFFKKSPITASIFALNILLFVGHIVLGFFITNGLLPTFGLVPVLVVQFNQWYRVVSTMFFHTDLLHIASNMLVLYILGTALERTLGPWRYALLYFISGIGSSLAVTFLTNPLTYTIGASGAIYGVMGALLYITFVRPTWFSFQSVKTIRTLMIINIIITFIFPNISIVGHLGGLGVGVLLSVLLVPSTPHFQKNIKKYDYGFETVDDGEGNWVN